MGLPAWRFGRNEQPGHQAVHLFRRQYHIMHQEADDLGRRKRQAGWEVQDRLRVAELLSNQPDHLVKAENIRADGIPNQIIAARPGFDSQFGDIVYKYRLDFILSVADLPEDGEMP